MFVHAHQCYTQCALVNRKQGPRTLVVKQRPDSGKSQARGCPESNYFLNLVSPIELTKKQSTSMILFDRLMRYNSQIICFCPLEYLFTLKHAE